jgi:hypothetical protein
MIRRFVFSILLATILSASVSAQDQESTPPTAPVYEHLKVLEPLIGDFVDDDDDPNRAFRLRVSASWSPRKQMVVWTAKAQPRGEEQWFEIPRRQYFYWNENAKRIERLDINAGRRSSISTYEVLPDDDGQFAFQLISSNRPGGLTSDSWTVSEDEIAMRGTRTNPNSGLSSQMRARLTRAE